MVSFHRVLSNGASYIVLAYQLLVNLANAYLTSRITNFIPLLAFNVYEGAPHHPIHWQLPQFPIHKRSFSFQQNSISLATL